jgi:dolichyl-phosphate-mannose--protein O-mannosyl transferase
MANPILLWFSSFSMLVLIGRKFLSFFTKFKRFKVPPLSAVTSFNTIILYIGLNYVANLLPWLKISRCTFFYHYMPAYLFSWFALAFILDNLLSQPQKNQRWLGLSIIGLILLGFIYWLPVFLGLPLLPQAFYLRMLLPSWI